MDNPRHRQLLRALRPHGADRLDPEAQPALRAAQADPALGRWFEKEQTFDRGLAERIQSVSAPADLRASILAAVEHAQPTRPARARRVLVQRPIATACAALAAAASLALLLVLLWPRQTRPVAVEDFVAAAAARSPDEIAADAMRGRSLADVRDWLAGHSAPVPGELPAAVARLTAEGVGVVVIHGVTGSVVTFEARGFPPDTSTGSTDRRLALFTLPRQSCSTAGVTREPTVREQAGRALAVWRDATSVYVLAVDAPADALRRFLAGARPGAITHAPFPAPRSSPG